MPRSRTPKREVVIRAGRVVIRARLAETPTADRIWQQLPIYSSAEIWGGSLHFETHVETGRERGAKVAVKPGDIGYWIERDRIIIGYGATPTSKPGQIRMPSPVNVFAHALDDVSQLALVQPGERVAVLHADS
ncbi:MAG: hypothetical protein KGP27_10010 [Hyphomicrobiales bacterium]|nr:hypothetical protein [Hyphomicrobiales bacterium]